MRTLLVVVAGLFIAFAFVIPFAKKREPNWFPTDAKPGTQQVTPRAHDTTSATKGCEDGVDRVDTMKMAPRLPRITTPQTIRAFVTAYDPYDKICVGDNAGILPRNTPAGNNVESPGIAVDPAVIPYGSTIEIPGMGTFTADDTGCAMRFDARDPNIKNFYHLDVRIPAPYSLFSTPDAARKEAHVIATDFGHHWLEVRIIPPSSSGASTSAASDPNAAE